MTEEGVRPPPGAHYSPGTVSIEVGRLSLPSLFGVDLRKSWGKLAGGHGGPPDIAATRLQH